MKYNYETIGKRIADERRNFCELSQEEFLSTLSQKYGIAMCRNTLSAIENGKYENFDFYFLSSLCEMFKCEMGYLLCEYECKTGRDTDISKETGLSETAIQYLRDLQYDDTQILNKILNHESGLDEILQNIKIAQTAASNIRPIQTSADFAILRYRKSQKEQSITSITNGGTEHYTVPPANEYQLANMRDEVRFCASKPRSHTILIMSSPPVPDLGVSCWDPRDGIQHF